MSLSHTQIFLWSLKPGCQRWKLFYEKTEVFTPVYTRNYKSFLQQRKAKSTAEITTPHLTDRFQQYPHHPSRLVCFNQLLKWLNAVNLISQPSLSRKKTSKMRLQLKIHAFRRQCNVSNFQRGANGCTGTLPKTFTIGKRCPGRQYLFPFCFSSAD